MPGTFEDATTSLISTGLIVPRWTTLMLLLPEFTASATLLVASTAREPGMGRDVGVEPPLGTLTVPFVTRRPLERLRFAQDAPDRAKTTRRAAD